MDSGVFAGGGESEVRGLIPFLRNNFPDCTVERKTPIYQKPGSKPNKNTAYGRTGQNLIAQIIEELPNALKWEKNKCDLILVFDDLDCLNSDTQKKKILDAISKISESIDIEKFVAFAAPELESWIIADWNNSIAKHPDFRRRQQGMRWWLSTKNVPFNHPESFSEYDAKKDSCQEKLSNLLIESTTRENQDNVNMSSFSKGLHTPELIPEINCDEVQRKCPLFRELYNYLNNFYRASQINQNLS